MQESWVEEELATVALEDKRLNRRLTQVLSTLSKASAASIPAACSGRAEMVATYRLFDNPKVDFVKVLEPHIDSTLARAAQQEVALLVEDTTELDLTRPVSRVAGTGPLQDGERTGVLMHLVHGFTPDGTPLGTVAAEVWARPPRPSDSQESVRSSPSRKRIVAQRTPLEEKESYRWLKTAEHLQELKKNACPETRLVLVADSESDIAEVLLECQAQPHIDWLIRSGAERVLERTDESEESISVRAGLLAQKVRYVETIEVRGRRAKVRCTAQLSGRKGPRGARTTEVSVRAMRLVLNTPRRMGRGGIEVNAVMVRETFPPPGEVPVEWILYTSLPIETEADLERIVSYYKVRWMIEVFFKTLKSGCRIEARRFEHMDRFLPCLALYLIVAWRSLYVCRTSRKEPEASCETVYLPEEWQSVWYVLHRRKPPKKPPSLLEMTCKIAELGGYVNRKGAGPPGPQTLWIGLQRMHDMATCWLTFGPGSQ